LAHGMTSRALLFLGRFAEAKDAAEKSLALMSKDDPNYAMAQSQAGQCAAVVELETRLPDVLSGTEQPDPGLRRAFATICLWKKEYAHAVRLFDQSFAADANLAADLGAGARLQAACAAARAAEQIQPNAADPSRANPKRTRFLNKALAWLRA